MYDVLQKDDWKEDDIQARAETLFNQAASIWCI